MKNNKGIKKTVLLSALAAIAFGTVAVTTSYALFTDTSETNVTVSAGKIDLSTTIGDPTYYSPTLVSSDGIADATNAATEDGFKNGGSVNKNGDNITISSITPGDKVTLPVTVTSLSSIVIKARFSYSLSDSSSKLNVTSTGLSTKWKTVEQFKELTEDGANIVIELPYDATEQEADVILTLKFEAVQGNAEVYDDVDNFSELSSYDFTFDTTQTDAVVLDGKNRSVANWTDAWFASDVTIKNVTFLQGATFSALTSKITGDVTITFENCTFYACQQANIDIENWKTQGGGNNNLSNSGDGLCLDVETDDSDANNDQKTNVSVVVKNCEFIGEDDITLDRKGYKLYNATTDKWEDKSKGRGHAIAINAINGQGGAKSVTIEGNTLTGIRGNAIQLYTFNYPITVSNNTINSWGRNNLTENHLDNDAAIRGTQGTGTLTLTNNYFGLDEDITNVSGENRGHYHVNVNNYSGNTDGNRTKGTY